jgi:hypothetical protein
MCCFAGETLESGGSGMCGLVCAAYKGVVVYANIFYSVQGGQRVECVVVDGAENVLCTITLEAQTP